MGLFSSRVGLSASSLGLSSPRVGLLARRVSMSGWRVKTCWLLASRVGLPASKAGLFVSKNSLRRALWVYTNYTLNSYTYVPRKICAPRKIGKFMVHLNCKSAPNAAGSSVCSTTTIHLPGKVSGPEENLKNRFTLLEKCSKYDRISKILKNFRLRRAVSYSLLYIIVVPLIKLLPNGNT